MPPDGKVLALLSKQFLDSSKYQLEDSTLFVKYSEKQSENVKDIYESGRPQVNDLRLHYNNNNNNGYFQTPILKSSKCFTKS